MLALHEQERLPHAILLIAPFGFALRSNARAIAKSLLCQERVANGCGRCKPCQSVESDSHGDYRRIAPVEGKVSIGVDRVRVGCDFVAQTSGYGDLKILTVEGADKMTVPAANALLKTLEEPQGNSLILLTAEFSWALPATIRSRCQQRIIQHPERAVLEAFLTSHGQGAANNQTSDYDLLRMAANAEYARPQLFELADSVLTALLAQKMNVSEAYAQLQGTDPLEAVSSLLQAVETSCSRETNASDKLRLLALLELQQVLRSTGSAPKTGVYTSQRGIVLSRLHPCCARRKKR